jgi:hypothetical protein
MSYAFTGASSRAILSLTQIASLGFIASVAFGANVATAQTARGLVDPRLFRAYSESIIEQHRTTCVPANGAQIMGGFAGSRDLIDARTGQICGSR